MIELLSYVVLGTALYRLSLDRCASKRRHKAGCCGGGLGGSRPSDAAGRPRQGPPGPSAEDEGRPASPSPEGDLETRFQAAADSLHRLVAESGNQLSQEAALLAYGLYKQATSGDASGPQPWATQLKARAKYDAWAQQSGVSRQDAMRRYVE
eukprot:CAMPEP_0177393746 /NCGR_PEP_ID=MMETSP0368-20130122/55133_1 /TAXON_ID=447022 ORGANISM="Scrippsiella hangoei-like, Strain SHHI-4" /NCGR_SAMPLE_ID=MMETSP0368 /ASSEMBLY_ACC=CAM_ASM_000363 /LENGTH=151 /DNA_ID=CAMNT_0018859985 /DNA_START=1 /DNA_END=453 /DNA_ORIENTATION=+